MKKLYPLLLMLFIACSAGSVGEKIPNPFEATYTLEGETSKLDGEITYNESNDNYIKFYIETDCNADDICPSTDIFIIHDFDSSLVFSKNFDQDSLSQSNTLLFPNGKCAVPFSGDSGTIEIKKDSDGSLNGTFNLGLKELNGYRPSPIYGCSQNTYSSDSLRTLTFEGSFLATEIESNAASN
ncbi:MAG: hypothetical protein ABJH08_09305 [Balneola sp.]